MWPHWYYTIDVQHNWTYMLYFEAQNCHVQVASAEAIRVLRWPAHHIRTIPAHHTVRSDLEEYRAITLSCNQRRTIGLLRGFSTTYICINTHPWPEISLSRGTRRAITKWDLTDSPQTAPRSKNHARATGNKTRQIISTSYNVFALTHIIYDPFLIRFFLFIMDAMCVKV
jgi:hypothetical protein